MKERPTRAQCEQAIAEGRAYGESRTGERNPYAGGPVALLSRLWTRAYQRAAEERRGRRIDMDASIARLRAAGIEVADVPDDYDDDADEDDDEPDGL